MDKSETQCAHEGCSCMTSSPSKVEVGGEKFCSQECADGRGCDHANCDCATMSTKPTPGIGEVPSVR